jgi:hypothetical protein
MNFISIRYASSMGTPGGSTPQAAYTSGAARRSFSIVVVSLSPGLSHTCLSLGSPRSRLGVPVNHVAGSSVITFEA